MATQSTWTDEMKEEVIAAYEKANPTPQNTADIVKDLADQYEKSVNGIRMILSRAGVYVTQEKKEKASGGAVKADKPKRVSKEEILQTLRDKISAFGVDPDEDVIGKLSGKAAQYFIELIDEIGKE